MTLVMSQLWRHLTDELAVPTSISKHLKQLLWMIPILPLNLPIMLLSLLIMLPVAYVPMEHLSLLMMLPVVHHHMERLSLNLHTIVQFIMHLSHLTILLVRSLVNIVERIGLIDQNNFVCFLKSFRQMDEMEERKAEKRQSRALLKNPGAPLANRSAPAFLSRYHR